MLARNCSSTRSHQLSRSTAEPLLPSTAHDSLNRPRHTAMSPTTPTHASKRPQHAVAQVWVYGFLAATALGTLGGSIAGTVVAIRRRKEFTRPGDADLYYPDWGHLPMATAWSALLSIYACY